MRTYVKKKQESHLLNCYADKILCFRNFELSITSFDGYVFMSTLMENFNTSLNFRIILVSCGMLDYLLKRGFIFVRYEFYESYYDLLKAQDHLFPFAASS